jgi:sugar phosphate isomerase/epimerase
MKTTGIAAQLYTLRDFLHTPDEIASALKRVKAIGYDGVQLSGLGPIDPKELANMLQGEGLVAAATHVPYNRLINDLPALIDEHKLWGCQNVAIGGLPEEFRNEEGYLTFARQMTEVAGKLKEAGLTFSYHNHNFEFQKYNGKTGMELMYENSDPNLFLAEIDTYWVQAGGANPVTWINKMRGRIVIIHYKDMTVNGWNQIMAEVGEGNLEWPAIIEASREAGVFWYAVEQDTCQRDPFESLAISFRNLKAMGLNPGV